MNLNQISNGSLPERTLSQQNTEIDRLTELVTKLNEENRSNYEKLKQTEQLMKEREILREEIRSKEKVIIGLKDKINLMKNSPPKIKYITETEYRNKCRTCDVEDVKEELKESETEEYIMLAYIAFVSLVSLLKNKVLRNDVFIALKTAIRYFTKISEYLFGHISKVFAINIVNPTVSAVLHWIIIVLFFLAVSIVSVFLVYSTFRRVKYYFIRKWDLRQTLTSILLATFIIHFSDVLNLKSLININLLITYIALVALFTGIRVLLERRGML